MTNRILLAVLVLCGSGAWGQVTPAKLGPDGDFICPRRYPDVYQSEVGVPQIGYELKSTWPICVVMPKSVTVTVIEKPEPIDVPAIQKDCTLQAPQGARLEMHGDTFTVTPEPKCQHPEMTCADKRRVLTHDEQEPPTFWCHKVQTGD